MTESISILKEYIEHLEYMKKNADKFFDREQADKDIETFKMANKALEQKTVTEQIREIADDICNNYCKWPDVWDEEAEGCELCESDHCRDCPLDRL